MIDIVWGFALIGIVVAYWKVRETLQWWSRRRSLRLHEEAETIRDHLLQESFTMRRMLETSLKDAPNPTMQGCLEQLNGFHQTLNALSDRLSPPYLQDDLSLSLAHLFRAWEAQQADVSIDLTLPPQWNQRSHQSDEVILEAVDELLRILTPRLLTPNVIFVSLSLSAAGDRFDLEVHVPTGEAFNQPDLRHLSRSLRYLTHGHCSYRSEQQMLIWHYWQHRSAASANPTCKD